MIQEPIITAKSQTGAAHVIDLAQHGYRPEPAPVRRSASRGFFAKIGAVLDDRIHF
jgi:hypothetical protein